MPKNLVKLPLLDQRNRTFEHYVFSLMYTLYYIQITTLVSAALSKVTIWAIDIFAAPIRIELPANFSIKLKTQQGDGFV